MKLWGNPKTKFKIGDRVRYVGDPKYKLAKPPNETGIVHSTTQDGNDTIVFVKWHTQTAAYPAESTHPSYYAYRLAHAYANSEF